MDKKILVLGGGGYIGSHLVEALLSKGYFVKVFDRNPIKFINQTKNKLEIIAGDITSDEDIANAITDCDICFHLIATVLPSSSNLNPIFDIETNLVRSIKLLDHIVKSKIKKIVFLSSGGTVYGKTKKLPIDENHPTNPLCSYGITKLAFEKYLFLYHQLYGLNYTILRLANPFGGRQPSQSMQGAIAVFFGKIMRNEIIEIWGDGSVIRDYIYISDLMNAMLCSIDDERSSNLFNIGSGVGHSLNEILEEMELITGVLTKRKYLNNRSFDVPVCVLDTTLAQKNLGWKPLVDFKDGLKTYWSNLSQNLMISESL